MSHARIEEVSDSDPEIDDPSDFLPSSDTSIISPVNLPPPSSSSSSRSNAPRPSSSSSSSFTPPPLGGQPQEMLRPVAPSKTSHATANRELVKAYQTLYPVYFDRGRTRKQGRRVSSSLAVANPLARTIVDAVSFATSTNPLRIAFEPDRLHPKDWANPGRVRVQLRDKATGRSLHPTIKNKSHLYILVAQYLQSHPTTSADPMKLQIQGLPLPEKFEAPAVPRGWKINPILPLHSPALSGGGVSDNFFKDMMAEMQKEGGPAGAGGQLPPAYSQLAGLANGAAGGSGSGSATVTQGGEGKKKKDKKKTKT